MRVCIVGAGSVGTTLASAWQRAGHDVVVGVRDPEGEHPRGSDAGLAFASLESAFDGAEAVCLAVPGAALKDLIAEHGPQLDARLLIDTTNRMGRSVMHQVPLLRHRLPNARVYRAFCSLAWEVFAEPRFGNDVADMPFCGPDGADRATVAGLISDVGMRPVWLGGLDLADTLDGVAQLWSALAMGRGLGRRVGLRILSDQPL